jgi:hypothetical protein
MRRAAFVVLSLLGLVSIVSAQSAGRMMVSIFGDGARAGMVPVAEPYITGGPWAAIPARALKPEITPSAASFRIKTWMENGSARVMVLAVNEEQGPDRKTIERETQVTTFTLLPNQSRQVTEAERYGARAFTVSADRQ